MKVNSNYNNRDVSFSGFYNSKALKKGLEYAADNGSVFAAGTSLALSLTAKPAAILSTPKTDMENRKLAFAKSLTSTFTSFLVMLLLANPISKGVKKINTDPKKYLNNDTIETLKTNTEELSKSKAYIFATQMFKLGIGLLAAIPKAIITAAGVPIVMNQISPPKPQKKNENIAFQGKIPENIANVLNNKNYQKFAQKYKDSNFPMHIIALSDSLTTATFIYQTQKNKNIKDDRKNVLCYNTLISTLLSIISSYILDKSTNKPAEKFIQKFKEANKTSLKLDKYIEGIKIAKPILITAGVYYFLIPFISTFFAERIEK